MKPTPSKQLKKRDLRGLEPLKDISTETASWILRAPRGFMLWHVMFPRFGIETLARVSLVKN